MHRHGIDPYCNFPYPLSGTKALGLGLALMWFPDMDFLCLCSKTALAESVLPIDDNDMSIYLLGILKFWMDYACEVQNATLCSVTM